MSSKVLFSNTILRGTNKGGVLKPDEHGYYTVVLGALGVNNSAGEHYSDTELARKTFESNSTLMRRIGQGLLRGEYAHPDPADCPNFLAFESRVRKIKEDRVSHHIHSVWLEKIDYKGEKVLGILAKLKPSGPYGSVLKEALDNPKENVTFSGRYYSNVSVKGGVRYREIHTVGTWDYVSEPGVECSQKYASPTLESRSELELSESIMNQAVEYESSHKELAMSMESSGYCAKDLSKDLGFKSKIQSTSKNMMDW